MLEGLLIAEDNIDEVIKTIRESYDNAKERLMERFNLSEIQAQVVLDMQLKRLQGLERESLRRNTQSLKSASNITASCCRTRKCSKAS